MGRMASISTATDMAERGADTSRGVLAGVWDIERAQVEGSVSLDGPVMDLTDELSFHAISGGDSGGLCLRTQPGTVVDEHECEQEKSMLHLTLRPGPRS